MDNIERERVYLLKQIPPDIAQHKQIKIIVGDLSDSNDFDLLKVRQKGDHYELIKKEFIGPGETKENVIHINETEFNNILRSAVRRHAKIRVFYPLDKYLCEIDFYQDELNGYVRAEVEFENNEDYQSFVAPDWFGQEISKINHDLHEGLGTINLVDMTDRLKQKGIELIPLFLDN